MVQSLVVGLIVAACAAYAAWALMPASWRRRLARRLGWRDPAPGCGGCDGCASEPDAKPREAVVTVHRTRA